MSPAAAITGLAALLHTSAVAFHTVKYLGVAYLLYMAWATWRDKDALTVEDIEKFSGRVELSVSSERRVSGDHEVLELHRIRGIRRVIGGD